MFGNVLRGQRPVSLIKRTVNEFIDDEMPTYAAALAYQMFFSLFPFLLFLIALLGYFDLQNFFDWLRDQARLVLPGQAMEQVDTTLSQLQEQQAGLFSVSIIVALWTASAGVRSAMDAMNKAYDIKEGRPVWKRFPLSIAYTIGLAILLQLSAGFMLIGPQVLNWLAHYVGLDEVMVLAWSILRWPAAIALSVFAVAMVYWALPDVKQKFRFITPGSVLSVFVWIVASLGFGYYVQNFSNYNAMYGSIGAIIVLMLYFYISSAVMLFGAELNAVIEHSHPEGKDPGDKVPEEDQPAPESRS
jgi:membrane protein